MRAFLRWLLGVPDVDVDRLRAIDEKINDVSDDVEHLSRRFTKLQGQVTRSWRRSRDPELEDDEELEPEDEVLDLIQQQRRAQRG